VAAIGAEEFDPFVPKLVPVAIEFAFTQRAGHPKNLRHEASQGKKIRNPNIETRIAPLKDKFTNRISKSETNQGPNKSNSRKIQNLESDSGPFGICSVWII
jgi:hypothetical protein